VKLPEGEISELLLWYRRRKLIAMTDRLFDLDVWQRIGDSAQVSNKEERLLAPVFRAVKSVISWKERKLNWKILQRILKEQSLAV